MAQRAEHQIQMNEVLGSMLIWVFNVRPFRRISVRLSDRSKVTQHICQKLSPVGFELTTSRSLVPCSDNWAREESVGDVWSELSFVSCTTSQVGLRLFLESIEHDFIKALMIPILNKTHWGQFLMKFILFCVTLELSDYLTEMRLKGLSWKTQLG